MKNVRFFASSCLLPPPEEDAHAYSRLFLQTLRLLSLWRKRTQKPSISHSPAHIAATTDSNKHVSHFVAHHLLPPSPAHRQTYSSLLPQTLHVASRFCSHTSNQLTFQSTFPQRMYHKQDQSSQSLRTPSLLSIANVKLSCTRTSISTHRTPCLSPLELGQKAAHLRGIETASWPASWNSHLDPPITYQAFFNTHLAQSSPKTHKNFPHFFQILSPAATRAYFQTAVLDQN